VGLVSGSALCFNFLPSFLLRKTIALCLHGACLRLFHCLCGCLLSRNCCLSLTLKTITLCLRSLLGLHTATNPAHGVMRKGADDADSLPKHKNPTQM
jgi:hypothetical protein